MVALGVGRTNDGRHQPQVAVLRRNVQRDVARLRPLVVYDVR